MTGKLSFINNSRIGQQSAILLNRNQSFPEFKSAGYPFVGRIRHNLTIGSPDRMKLNIRLSSSLMIHFPPKKITYSAPAFAPLSLSHSHPPSRRPSLRSFVALPFPTPPNDVILVFTPPSLSPRQTLSAWHPGKSTWYHLAHPTTCTHPYP